MEKGRPALGRWFKVDAQGLLEAGRFVGASIALAISFLLLFDVEGYGSIFTQNLHPRKAAVLFLALATLLIASVGPIRAMRLTERERRRLEFALVGLGVALSMLVGRFILHSYLTDDEFVYLFQANTYAHGRVWNVPPVMAQALTASFMAVANGKWFGMYPPGWPLALVPGVLLGVPRLTAVLVAAGVLVLANRLFRAEASPLHGLLGFAVFTLAPFTVFNLTTLYSHPFCCLLVLVSVIASRKALADGDVSPAVLTGIAVGILGMTRTLSAVIVALPIGIAFLRSTHRTRLCAAAASGALPFAVGLLLYQYLLTGSPFKSPYWLAGRTIDHLYFDAASLRKGAELTVIRLCELGLWSSPIIVPGFVVAIIIKIKSKTISYIDWIFPAAVALYIFYPLSPSYQFGPRYLFEFWPLAIYSIVSAIPTSTLPIRRIALPMMAMSCVYGVYALPFLSSDLERVSSASQGLDQQIDALQLRNAIICIRPLSDGVPGLKAGDLARNDVDASGTVLRARCDMASPAALGKAYPGRSVWLYERRSHSTVDHLRLAGSAADDAGTQWREALRLERSVDHSSAIPRRRSLIAGLASALTTTISKLGYGGVTLLMAIESACIPLPSELIMPFAGYLVSLGQFNLLLVATAGAIGCNLGSIPAYIAGAQGARPLIRRWGKYVLIHEADLDRAQAFFEKWGPLAVLVGRMLPVIRTFIAVPAGAVRMHRGYFHLYTFLGSWPWCFALAWIGMKLGTAWDNDPRLRLILHGLDGMVALAALIAASFYFWQRQRGKHRPQTI